MGSLLCRDQHKYRDTFCIGVMTLLLWISSWYSHSLYLASSQCVHQFEVLWLFLSILSTSYFSDVFVCSLSRPWMAEFKDKTKCENLSKLFFSEPGFKSTGKASAIWSKLSGVALLFIGHDIMQLASWPASAGCHDSQCHWHLVGTETRSPSRQEEMKRKNDKRTRNVILPWMWSRYSLAVWSQPMYNVLTFQQARTKTDHTDTSCSLHHLTIPTWTNWPL